MHVKKKWWGGPLAGFAPQSQARAAMQGLGQLAMPGGPPQQTAVTQAPMMPSLSALMAPPARGFQGPMGSFAEGGIPGAGKTKVPIDTMGLKSKVGLSRLPDDFYYMPGIKPGAKPENFMPPSPAEKQLNEQNPEQFGRPVAGLLHSEVPGRTDQLPVSVAAGSYVIPADIISGLGQGNTTAGAKMFLELLQKTGETPKMADGGKPPIPIVAAGGEYVVPPGTVAALGGGDEAKGHEILDKFVLSVRSSVADRLRKLPPPRRD